MGEITDQCRESILNETSSLLNTEKDLLLIFTRNPEPGKCKTRLAATIGDKAALEIYRFLISHTVQVTRDIPVTKIVYYTEEIWHEDQWDSGIYKKELQRGPGLGERMNHAFNEGFSKGFNKIVIIGSDLFELERADLENAFKLLDTADYVIGPAKDGGYYLLGMKGPDTKIFKNKAWGTASVFKETLKDLGSKKVALLPEKNDIDYYEDIKGSPVFQPFIKHIEND